jgi:tetratricopeptide (TPR) repeat protein
VAHKAELDPSTLMSLEITFNNTRGDFVRLEQLYREYLTREDVSNLEKAAMRNNLAFLLAVTNRGTEALDVIGDAIEQLGPLAALKDTEAMAYLASGRMEEALTELRTIASSGQATPGMYFHLALAEHRSGNTAAAVEAFQKAQQMGLSEATLDPPEIPIYQKLLKALGPELQKESSDLELSAR